PTTRQRENLHIAFVPEDGQLARTNLPARSGPYETVRVIAVHDLVASTRLIGQMMTRLHVGHAGGLIAVQRNDLIGDHVLRGRHAVDGAADTFDPVVGLDTRRRAAHSRRQIGLDLVRETGPEQRPVAHIHACSITELHVADGGAVQQQLPGVFADGHGATYSVPLRTRQGFALPAPLRVFTVTAMSLICHERGVTRGSWPPLVRHTDPLHTPLTTYIGKR